MATIALDAMGGDNGVQSAVHAAANVSLKRDAAVLLVGDQAQIDPILSRARYDAAFLSVHHTPQAIDMCEDPRAAIEAKPDASLLVGARLVTEGQADALVSAGNTGAAILACARHFKKLPGVPRTALAAVYPTEQRRGVHEDPFALILDVGATVHVDADTLVAFAHMGSAYAARISRNPRPRVALLSNGSEPYKGTPEIVEAHKRLAEDPKLHFIGNIEGVDLPRGKADVVVTAGFTGNVVLKMLEGISETVVDIARYAYRSKLVWRAGLWMLRGGIVQLKSITDWQQYGGAPILGFDHLFIKAHGRSNARAIANAIKVANKAVKSDLCKEIATQLEDAPAR
ncbi:MAG: phosphate acyltransferase PlsX [Myxococcales bacterium]|nr:phosphate acyltransferase PlsX [Myxococcales bacterium]